LCNIVNNYVTVGERLITEGFNAADNSLLVSVILPIALDNCQNSVVGEAAGGKQASCKGFFRLTVEEFCQNAMPQLNESSSMAIGFSCSKPGKISP
jgi:hypothetical protein